MKQSDYLPIETYPKYRCPVCDAPNYKVHEWWFGLTIKTDCKCKCCGHAQQYDSNNHDGILDKSSTFEKESTSQLLTAGSAANWLVVEVNVSSITEEKSCI